MPIKKPTRFILVESEGQVVVRSEADQAVAASMAVLTFISAAFCGEFLSRAFAAGGCYALGVLMLSAAIFRAAGRLHANSYLP
ncbi:MAG: hypothetical protein ACREVA_01710 [Burkholderiales bacterium]